MAKEMGKTFCLNGKKKKKTFICLQIIKYSLKVYIYGFTENQTHGIRFARNIYSFELQ